MTKTPDTCERVFADCLAPGRIIGNTDARGPAERVAGRWGVSARKDPAMVKTFVLATLALFLVSGNRPPAVKARGTLSDRFDREVLTEGPGTRLRAGLIAVAEPAVSRRESDQR